MSGLPAEGSPEHGWLIQRAGAVRSQVLAADPGWRGWAEQALYADPIGASLARVAAGDPVGGEWDEVRGPALRASLGQVFTPPALARLLADLLSDEDGWPSPVVLDPACGAGSLLHAVCARRHRLGWSVAAALAAVEGWDRDPVAAWLCRVRLVEWALTHPDGSLPGTLRVHGGVDALSEAGRPRSLIEREAPFGAGVGAVIGNPPYLEAKRMRSAEPGLRERLRTRFPQLSGAFDLYLAFCWLALDLVGEGGEVAFLLPNKVCQGRYAAGFRARLLQDGPPALVRLVDLSRLKPRPFPGTSVYPVALQLRRRAPPPAIEVRRVVDLEQLSGEDWQPLSRAALRRVGGEHPLFAPFAETWPDLEPLFDGPRLGQVARLVSTCSFHVKGLREQFVGPVRPASQGYRYLGLHSRTRKTEVGPFEVRWAGGWIHYDQESLKRVHRNPLPSLDTFLRPKAIWSQHGLRMRAVADPEGRWVTKDTYPVGWPIDPRWTLPMLVAVLNSTVFTALHNTVYQGIVVGGETYHYLPAFLKHVPVPDGAHPALVGVGLEQVADPSNWLALDRLVSEAYGVSEPARRRMAATHLARVGAQVPG